MSRRSKRDFKDAKETDISKKHVLVFLVGPTAVGKTEFGIRLAQHLGTEIISADSMQVYQYMDIGTGKPTPQERDLVRHHLIDFVHPSDAYSVGRYAKDAEAVIREFQAASKIPLLVGGTGLYVRALSQGLFQGPEADHDIRNRLKEFALTQGPNSLYNQLKSVDPVSAQRIHPNDQRRAIRALEVYEITGRPISELQEEERLRRTRSTRSVIIGLTSSRNRLYTRIEQRVDRMIQDGLVGEVQRIKEMGIDKDAVSMQGLGYKEMLPYLNQQLSLDRAVDILKQETRHFAKRQMTWFKAVPAIEWIDIGAHKSPDKAIQSLIDLAESRLMKDPHR